MKVLTTLMTLLILTNSWGQKTKKKTFESKSLRYKEIYHVLKDNPEIKHGEYIKSNNRLLIKGHFDQNKRVGIWESTGRDGQLEQRIDFTNNIVTNFNSTELSRTYWTKDGETFKEIKPDEPPVFIGGNSWFYHYFLTMRYPPDARRNGIQGKIFMSAIITKDGKMIEKKIEKGLGFGLDEEASRVFQMIPDDWIPAKVNGEAVDIKILIPLTFKIA